MLFRTRRTMRGPGRAANAIGGRPWFQSNRFFPYTPAPTRGPELITNGDFADASVWITEAGWSIAGGFAVAALGIVGGSRLIQNVTVVLGTQYELIVTTSGGTYAGGLTTNVGGGGDVIIAADGTLTTPLTAGNTGAPVLVSLVFFPALLNDFNGNVDNVSLREILN